MSQAAQLQVPAGYSTIQAAIAAAADGDEIVLAAGVHTGPGNRDVTLDKSVLIRSADPLDPAVVAATVIDCQASAGDPHRAFTLSCRSDTHDAGLAGLTITGAYTAQGVVTCEVDSAPEIRHCVIRDNTGSGVYCRPNSFPRIRDCRIESNVTSGNGGGICLVRDCSPLIQRCIIRGNNAALGGGVYSYQSWPDIQSSEITGSYAESGGGLYWIDSGVSLENCTVAGNSAQVGAGACGLSEIYMDRSSITNSIFWGNMAGDGHQITLAVSPYTMAGDTLAVAYSLVQGGQAGIPAPAGWTLEWQTGNLAAAADPLFAQANGPDGQWDTWQDNDYHLASGSPCTDAGDPTGSYAGQTDPDGHPRLRGLRVDLGAYEAVPYVVNPVPGDANGDGHVDVADLLMLVDAFGKSVGMVGYDPACDFDASGDVDVVDLLTLVDNFGT
jgi:parallel beta-helix repeat protein